MRERGVVLPLLCQVKDDATRQGLLTPVIKQKLQHVTRSARPNSPFRLPGPPQTKFIHNAVCVRKVAHDP
jgi:hypothetical protein